MAPHRRNRIAHADAYVVTVIAAASGVLAALAGCEPTGSAVPDAVITGALGALVAWLGASSPWWGLFTAAGVASVGAALSGTFWLIVVGWAAMLVVGELGYRRLNQPAVRTAVAGAVVQVVLRLDWDPFFLASALVAAIALALIAYTGWIRRQRYVRRRVLWALEGVGAAAVVATAMFGLSAAMVRSDATDGYHAMLRALEYLQDGDLDEANGALDEAAVGLGSASESLDGVLTQPARLVPVVAQNRNISIELLGRAAEAADAAGGALDVVDLDRLKIIDGAIDIEALAELEPALAELEATVFELQDALDDAESPWLVGPLDDRLDNAGERADQAAVQAVASHAAAQVGPALLGADGPRRYFLAFTNPAEARGQSGLMGNWNEVTIDAGRIEITATGRTADLESGIDASPPIFLDMPQEYFDRYGGYGAGGPDDPVRRKYWGNAFITPDTPSVGKVLAQMLEASTDRTIDGVVIMDPAAIAGLLELTGPISVPELDQQLTSDNVEEFLTLGQYEYAENEREDFLAAVTSATVDQVLGSTLPPPQVLGAALGPAATEGHLSAWAVRPDEQRLLELVGMEAAMPVLERPSTNDALAVTNNNASGNKIDSFLERTIQYRADHDESSGTVVATLDVTLTNTAPTTGYEDYVIGNIVDLPPGTNRTLLEIWTPLNVNSVTIDGVDEPPYTQPELGWNVKSILVDIPPGQSVSVIAELSGLIAPGDYKLVYRPQPLPRDDLVVIEATSDGDRVIDFEGQLPRRSTLTADVIEAWRPADHPAL